MDCNNILNIDLEVPKNKTEVWTLTFSEDNAAIDITDYTIYFTVKEKKSDLDADAKLTKTVTTHTDAVNGESELYLSKADTNSLAIGQYYYSIEYNNGETGTDLSEEILQSGRLTITRPTRIG